jgi:hypothetical protein
MYEINVSLNGKHFFATAERSIHTESNCVEVLKVFKKAFPESEGYSITVTYQQKIGKILDVDKLLGGK